MPAPPLRLRLRVTLLMVRCQLIREPCHADYAATFDYAFSFMIAPMLLFMLPAAIKIC
jgi:hypothetical protein